MAAKTNRLNLRIVLLVLSLPVCLLVLSTTVVALVQGDWLVFLPVLIVGSLVFAAAAAVAIGLCFAFPLVSAWGTQKTQEKTPTPKASAPVTTTHRKNSFPVQVDESVRLTGIYWLNEVPPTLYVDDYTVMQEVSDLLMLREGDHCMVGLNVMHKFSPIIDAFVSRQTSWEAAPLRMFHHFIVLDTVTQVCPQEGPLRADGKPVRLAEFSDTLTNAIDRVFGDGYNPRKVISNALELIASPARYHLAPLSDYLPPSRRRGRRGNGILLVCQTLTAEQRAKVVSDALALEHAPEMPIYAPFFANCEHACFMVSSQGRWVSPQIAYLLWHLFRLVLQCLGAACLVGLATTPRGISPALWHGVLAAVFHLFSTFVVTAAVQVQLVRSAVNLTQRREVIGEIAYHYLMVKETMRAVVAGGICIGTIAMMPRLVWDTGYLGLACALSMSMYGIMSVIFNVSHQLVVRALLRSGIGVPVPLFEDLRNPGGTGRLRGLAAMDVTSEPGEAQTEGAAREIQERESETSESATSNPPDQQLRNRHTKT